MQLVRQPNLQRSHFHSALAFCLWLKRQAKIPAKFLTRDKFSIWISLFFRRASFGGISSCCAKFNAYLMMLRLSIRQKCIYERVCRSFTWNICEIRFSIERSRLRTGEKRAKFVENFLQTSLPFDLNVCFPNFPTIEFKLRLNRPPGFRRS